MIEKRAGSPALFSLEIVMDSQEVFNHLMVWLEVDNGCTFKVTPEQRMKAYSVIPALQSQYGLFNDDPDDLESTFATVVTGDDEEVLDLFNGGPTPAEYQELSQILNEIFDNPV